MERGEERHEETRDDEKWSGAARRGEKRRGEARRGAEELGSERERERERERASGIKDKRLMASGSVFLFVLPHLQAKVEIRAFDAFDAKARNVLLAVGAIILGIEICNEKANEEG
jgi:hypothetical protein